MSDVERAEWLGRKRATLLIVMGLLLPLMQFLYLGQPDNSPPTRFKLVIWTFLIMTTLFTLITGGGFGHGQKVRLLATDESVLANRDTAVRLGFSTAMLAGLIVFLFAQQHTINAQLAAFIILNAGLTPALLGFGVLEWRGHRLG